jgi:hypothetical protein
MHQSASVSMINCGSDCRAEVNKSESFLNMRLQYTILGGIQPPLCHFSDRPHVVINSADIFDQEFNLRHKHIHYPSIESLSTFDNLQHEKLGALGHVMLLPLLCHDDSNCSHECTEDLNTIHESVVVFLIINLGDHLHESISGREGFSQFHCCFEKRIVAGCCREFPTTKPT